MRFRFTGLYHGDHFYRRSHCKFAREGVKVKTFGSPATVADMTAALADDAPVLACDQDQEDLIKLTEKGKLTDVGAQYLLPLLSEAEANVLQLFGLDLGKIADGSLKVSTVRAFVQAQGKR